MVNSALLVRPALGYAAPIFLGAFLLFQLQPLIARSILPCFGGSAAVWSTCLAFFQAVLVLGYLYAAAIRRLAPRRQAIVHVVLLASAVLLLPVLPSASWKPQGPGDPTLAILGLLASTVGLPYFVLATTGPLLQAWYADAHPDGTPYRLYALSNAGSMLALITYPVVVEPSWGTYHQALGWSAAYVVFTVLCGWIAIAHRGAGASRSGGEVASVPAATRRDRLLWLALPACASLLLLAVTSHLSQDVAPVPFLWIVPLTLYLASFILGFESDRWYRRHIWVPLVAVGLGGVAYALLTTNLRLSVPRAATFYGTTFFACCMFCHCELARLRPHPSRLTSFYLTIAIGGAAGGLFGGLLAPRLFNTYLEFPIGLLFCAALIVIVVPAERSARFRFLPGNPAWLTLLAFAVVLAGYLGTGVGNVTGRARVTARNFYGVLRVTDDETTGHRQVRELVHGRVVHGSQYLASPHDREATTYYSPRSGVGLLLGDDRAGARRVGVVGLGAGTLAAYGRAGDHFRFYEINPLVVRLARSEFTFLSGSPAVVDIVEGDGRLSLEQEPDQRFDVLVVDAFSGDSIPVHLLTREALVLYFRHLVPDGVLAVHLSNKYLDLAPVVRAIADGLGKPTVLITTKADPWDEMVFPATWMLVANGGDALAGLRFGQAATVSEPGRGAQPWTDDYSNLWRTVR